MAKGTEKNDWARAVRDIGIKAIDSGQFLLFGFYLVVIIILIKMPSDIIGDIIKQLFSNLLIYATNGYVLFFLTLIACGLYVKALSKRHKKQIVDRDQMIEDLNSRLLGIEVKTGEKIK